MRKNFPKWMVDRKFIEQDGVCDTPGCFNPLVNGFHRHHKNGKPEDNRYENLGLKCLECHYATFAEQHKDYSPLKAHQELTRQIIEWRGEALARAMIGEITGSTLERMLDGWTQQLSDSWKEKGLKTQVEYPSATFALLRHIQKSEIITEAMLKGYELGLAKRPLSHEELFPKEVKKDERS